LAQVVDMPSGLTCGSRSDTGENRQVPREKSTREKKLEEIILIGAVAREANRFDDASQRKVG
jgi:hypothetical protein